MRFGINLRGDLAKLSDSEITAEFDRLFAERQALEASMPTAWSARKWQWNTWPWTWLGRGPVHARICYKLAAIYFGPAKNIHGALYLLECEIKDVRDEIQRRIDGRKMGAEAAR
jgi:hypothetical protein